VSRKYVFVFIVKAVIFFIVIILH